MKVREPVARPLDVIAAELLLTISQAFVVGVLLYLALGVWDERGVAIGSVVAILVALAFAVGAAWLYWLLGGTGLPLAAAELPVALFLAFALLLGLRGEEIVRIAPLPLVLTLAASIYGIVAGVFLDPPRRLRWDQRRAPRRQEVVPRISPTTAMWLARARGMRRSASSGTTPGSRRVATARQPAPVSSAAPGEADGALSVPAAVPSETIAAPSRPAPTVAAPTVAAPDVPARPVVPLRQPSRKAGGGEPPAPAPPAASSPAVELPTSVEPRAQRSPWAWARPPEWNRDEDEFETDRDGDRS